MRFARALRHIVPVVAAAVIVLSAGVVDPQPAQAGGDQLQTRGISTYELVPARHVIHVTTVYTLTNKAPSSSKRFDCSYWAVTWYGSYYVPATCTRRTNYYYNGYSAWVEKDATSVKVKANSGSAKLKKGKVDGGWRTWKISISPLWYGKTRVLTLSYDLPAGGPRAPLSSLRRGSYGYADFCAFGPGSDKGEARIVVPSGYQLTTTGTMTSRETGGKVIYTSGMLKAKPWQFKGCVSGAGTAGYDEATVTTPGGTAFTVASWKDDPTWRDAVTAAINGTYAPLESVLGKPGGGLPTTIRETVASAASSYGLAGTTWNLAETTLDADAIARGLVTQAWLPGDTFSEGWIKTGYIDWATAAGGGGDVACGTPGAAPDVTKRDLYLSQWTPATPNASATAKAVWAYKRNVACYLVKQVADAAGPEKALAALTAVREGWDAWSPADAPVERADKVLTWHDWLDIVTERALVPAGADADLVSALIEQYDPSVDPAELAAHKQARDAYHAYQQRYGSVPAFITDAMRAWDFPTAQAGLDAAAAAAETAATVPSILPGVDVAGGKVEAAIKAAGTQDDLDAAKSLAAKQVTAAKDVADAFALEAAPRDTLQQLGLAGATVPDHKPAIAAVVAIDEAGAHAQAESIRSLINGARDAGTTRAALGGGGVLVVVVLLVVGVLFARRRSRPAAAPALAAYAPPVVPPAGGYPPAAYPGSGYPAPVPPSVAPAPIPPSVAPVPPPVGAPAGVPLAPPHVDDATVVMAVPPFAPPAAADVPPVPPAVAPAPPPVAPPPAPPMAPPPAAEPPQPPPPPAP